MNILILYTSLTEYWVACMRHDVKANGNQYLVFRQAPNPNAPFQLESEESIEILNENDYNLAALVNKVDAFTPDIVYTSGWTNKKYLKLVEYYKKKGIPTITGLDNQWQGKLRQKIGVLLAPWKVKKYFSHIWIAGMLQYEFARQLGFSKENILTNLYSCNLDKFNHTQPVANKRFVFLGRLVEHKGVDILIEAFKQFKQQTNSDWTLHVIGNGQYAEVLKSVEGIVHQSFIQPQDVPAELHKGGVFVLPSRYEAWGVVVHEAAAASMPVITTSTCGAARHLVYNGYNGYTIQQSSVDALAQSMLKIAALPENELIQMGLNSNALAQSINPAIWSAQLNSVIK